MKCLNTYENCFQEAKKYTTRTAFQKGCGRAYYVAWENKWLKDYSWFIQLRKPKNFWTYDRCENESKKYKTKKEFMKGCPSAYCISQNNNWLKNYDCFMSSIKSDGLRDYENCYQEAKKYKSRKPTSFWNYKNCKKEAKKYKSK